MSKRNENSHARYIELDSTFRNRTQYPNPASYIAPIAQSGMRNTPQDAFDPILDSFPVLQTVAFEQQAGKIYSGGTNVDPKLETNATSIDNVYRGSIITTEGDGVVSEISMVTGYDGVSHAITLETPFLLSTWEPTDTYTLTTLIPITNTEIFLTTGSKIDDFYNGYQILHLTDAITGTITNKTITDYDGKFAKGTIADATGFTAQDENTLYLVKKNLPFASGNPSAAMTDTNTVFTIPVTYTIDNALVGKYITIYTATTTETGFITISVASATNTLITVNGISTTPVGVGTDYFEIHNFSRDNANPFIYNGSVASQQQTVCYEITLLNLILPNVPLSVSEKGYVLQYPYVYVELSNVSASNYSSKNIIYSNNPNSRNALFRVPVDNITTPFNADFINFERCNMSQTVKFKPNDNLKFSVFLPNGELFTTAENDDLQFIPPKSRLQISVLFSITRLE